MVLMVLFCRAERERESLQPGAAGARGQARQEPAKSVEGQQTDTWVCQYGQGKLWNVCGGGECKGCAPCGK